MKVKKYSARVLLAALLCLVGWSCEEDAILADTDLQMQSAAGDQVNIANSGFESSWSGWNDTDPSALSSDANSGSKSAKITGSSGRFVQTVSVSANTNYTLQAYVLDNGKIGVIAGGNDYNQTVDHSNWSAVSVSFNSGSSTSVTIYGAYGGGEGRFDDFSLTEGAGGNSSAGQLIPVSVSANGDDGNVPQNTIDGNLGTRWSSNGYTGKYITYDLGSNKSVSSMKIAWYKGDQRQAYFKIRVGTSTSNLATVYDGSTSGSSGNTTGLESYDFAATTARYVRVSGFGNSSNSWNSITEAEIYGNGGDPQDTTPPGAVSNLSANAGDGSVNLSWSNPGDSDFSNVEISYNGNTITTSNESRTISGLTNGNQYTFTVIAYDNAGNASASRSVSATPQGSNPQPGQTNLANWKLTLPVSNSSGSLSGGQGDAYEVPASTLANWTSNSAIPNALEPYFYYNSSGNMEFYCVYTGITTSSNTQNSRTELREMITGTDDQYNWTIGEGGVMEGRFRVKDLNNASKLFAMQIHGKAPESKPLLKIIWDNGKIRALRKINSGGSWVDDEDTSSRVNVAANEWVKVKITCNASQLRVDVNDQEMITWTDGLIDDWGSNNTFYFKAGNYLQHHDVDEGHSAVVEYDYVYITH